MSDSEEISKIETFFHGEGVLTRDEVKQYMNQIRGGGSSGIMGGSKGMGDGTGPHDAVSVDAHDLGITLVALMSTVSSMVDAYYETYYGMNDKLDQMLESYKNKTATHFDMMPSSSGMGEKFSEQHTTAIKKLQEWVRGERTEVTMTDFMITLKLIQTLQRVAMSMYDIFEVVRRDGDNVPPAANNGYALLHYMSGSLTDCTCDGMEKCTTEGTDLEDVSERIQRFMNVNPDREQAAREDFDGQTQDLEELLEENNINLN